MLCYTATMITSLSFDVPGDAAIRLKLETALSWCSLTSKTRCQTEGFFPPFFPPACSCQNRLFNCVLCSQAELCDVILPAEGGESRSLGIQRPFVAGRSVLLAAFLRVWETLSALETYRFFLPRMVVFTAPLLPISNWLRNNTNNKKKEKVFTYIS